MVQHEKSKLLKFILSKISEPDFKAICPIVDISVCTKESSIDTAIPTDMART